MNPAEQTLNSLIDRHRELSGSKTEIAKAYDIIRQAFADGNKILICGNGGSAADSDHIAGELMKGFMKKRPVSDDLKKKMQQIDPVRGALLSASLQGALPAIALTMNTALNTAVMNDNDPKLIYAQQVAGYGKTGDVLLGISTSGNAENVIHAMIAAKAYGLKVIGLSGPTGGKMAALSDVCIKVPGESTSMIQELHLPVYHALCKMIEETFFAI